MSSPYHSPRKGILTKEHLEAFQTSETHETIVNYIQKLNEGVVGVKLTDDCEISPVCYSDRSGAHSCSWNVIGS